MDGNSSELNEDPDDITQNNDNDTVEPDDNSSDTDDESDANSDTEYETDDEIDSAVEPLILNPLPSHTTSPNIPVQLEIVANKSTKPSPLPLCMMLNARSLHNKRDNFKNLLYEVGPDLAIVSETWERQRQSLENLLSSEQFQVISYKRKQINNRQPGGAVLFSSTVGDLISLIWKLTPQKELKHVGLYYRP